MEFFKNKNVFITGIGGFLGSSLAQNLIAEEANVVGLVRSINKPQDWFENARMYVGDVTDYKLVREIISANEIDIIYHLAAYSIVRISSRDPLTAYNVNVMGTVNVLEAAREVGRCQKILIASSDKAMGDHKELPYREDFPLQPKNTYDVSKACMDLIGQSYGTNYNLPVLVTRCSNIYGPGDFNYSRLIPNTILRVLHGKKPLLYSDVENMEREFIYIEDVLEAYRRLSLVKSQPGEVFNIGNNSPVKISEVVKTITKLMGKGDLEVEVIKRENNFKEINKQAIDPGKLKKYTNWENRFSLEQGLKETINWYSSL